MSPGFRQLGPEALVITLYFKGALGPGNAAFYAGLWSLSLRLEALGVQPPLGGFQAGANTHMRKQK